MYCTRQNQLVQDLATDFDSFGFEYKSCLQFIDGFRLRSSFVFNSNTADERLLLETHVKHIEKHDINMIGTFVLKYSELI